MNQITKAKEFSSGVLDKLRLTLACNNKDFVIVAGGSLARREASEKSDLDFFCFGENPDALEAAKKILHEKSGEILKIVPKPPSSDGAFGPNATETKEQLIYNIGGSNDTNKKLTHRILFLLEGEWLHNGSLFGAYRREVVSRYVPEHIRKEKICRFLLNDIIRYYRTVCVDFEYKTAEIGKSYGTRSIKLRFSRKMLYFGGIVAVAETAGLERNDKIDKLVELLAQPAIERIGSIFENTSREALDLYEEFLANIADESTREKLELVVDQKSERTAPFEALRRKSREFTNALDKMLREKYQADHPIHQALLF